MKAWKAWLPLGSPRLWRVLLQRARLCRRRGTNLPHKAEAARKIGSVQWEAGPKAQPEEGNERSSSSVVSGDFR